MPSLDFSQVGPPITTSHQCSFYFFLKGCTMKRMFMCAVLIVLLTGGCGEQISAVREEIRDPNSPTQKVVEDINKIGETIEPIVKIVEKTPWGAPVSLVFNGVMGAVAFLYQQRRKKERKALQGTVASLQVLKSSLAAASPTKNLIKEACNVIQDAEIQAEVAKLRADPTTKILVDNALADMAIATKTPTTQ